MSLTGERRLAPSTIRNYQMELRLFSEFLVDGRYGWGVACEEAFGTHPEPPWIEWRLRSGHLKDRGDGGALFTVARLVVDRREVVDRRMQSVRVEPADPFGGLPLDLSSAGP